MTTVTLVTNRTTNGLTDTVVATADQLFVVATGNFDGAQVEFQAAFTDTPVAGDWVGIPDLMLTRDRPVWPLCVNQLPFKAPHLRARLSAVGPQTSLTISLTDGNSSAA